MHYFVEIVGWAGAVLILAAYALLSLGKLHGRSAVYQWMNVVGSAGFVVNSGWNGAYPSAALNVVWMGIGAYVLLQRRGRIEALTGLIRNSSVVMAELWRGVVTSADREVLRALVRNHPMLTPTEKNWLDSGELLAKMRADRGFSPAKLRDLHFDVLIALTARSHGARLITSNRSDFETIASYCKLQLEIW